MDFGDAIKRIRQGECLRRVGWNGKGMHVYIERHLSVKFGAGVFTGQKRNYKPVFVLFNAQGEHQLGWVPSQDDMDAEDWEAAQ